VSKKPTSEAALRQRVYAAFASCCAYCRAAQEHVPEILEIEHIRPRSRGGSDAERNLCLACGHCNRHKAARLTAIDPKTRRRVALFNPRSQQWSEHFRWGAGSIELVGLTPCGRATVAALQLNANLLLKVRAHWLAAGWHPQPESRFTGLRS